MQLFKLIAYILILICVSFADDCAQYTSDTDCPSDYCHWYPNAGTAGECHQEGPPDCINDCVGFSSMTPQTNHTDWCTWLSGVWENGSASCMTDCSEDDMTISGIQGLI